MAQAARDETGGWRLPPLAASALTGEAVRTAWAGTRRLWPVWLVWLAVDAGVFAGMRAWVGEEAVLPFPQAVASTVVITLLFAIPAGVTLRAFLDAPGLWRADRGFMLFALVGLGFTAAAEVPISGLMSVLRAGRASLETLQWTGFAAGVVMWLLLIVPSTRLTPWGAGLLVGDPRATLRHSWFAMKGVVRPVIAADVILSAAPYVVHNLAWSTYYVSRGPIALAVTVASHVAWTILLLALQAAVYRRRLAGAERLADVFD